MVYSEFAKGTKDIGIIIGPKLYSWSQFIGTNFGLPLKKYAEDFPNRVIGISTLEKADGKKVTKKELVQQCSDILEACDSKGIDKLLVVSSDYFKYLTGAAGFETEVGLLFPCTIEGYKHINVFACISPAVISAQPGKKPLLTKAIKAFGAFLQGTYEAPKEFQFESYELVTTISRAQEVLEMLLTKDILAIDTETTGLKVGPTEILTIAFAWDKYNAVTFACHEHWECEEDLQPLLLEFFDNYKGTTVYHNALFDLKQMAYSWYMKDFSNHSALYSAMEALGVDRVDDTMLLAYAELNSTDRTPLGLKALAKDFMGDWAEDVKDCKLVPLDQLAEYNAKDCCATMYVYDLYKHQKESRGYKEILQPSLKPLLHMMLNGLPIDLTKVNEVDDKISVELGEALKGIRGSSYVNDAEENLKYFACEKYNATHVGDKEPYQFDVEFNPNSATQLRVLLFDVMGFEPIGMTDGGAAKTDRASIAEFLGQLSEDDPKYLTLKSLIGVSETSIIQNTFISAFKELSLLDSSGGYTLHGNLRLGATQSSRLSSSEPNLQNIPSGSTYGGMIKGCFVAPAGWMIAYSDFAALESRIGAILSGDINSTRQYTENIDGHSMNTAAMFKEELEERGIFIDMHDAESINRIKTEAKDLRNGSKRFTFGLQYGCGAGKIQSMLKGTRERADSIYSAFHGLYSGLAAFSKKNEVFAQANGYINLAFGLQLKTPRIGSKDPAIQSGEARSASNAASQSYGMLMNRTFIEFLARVEVSPFKYDIKLVNTIHDSFMLLIKKDIEVAHWVNENLVECMKWRDDPVLLASPVTLEAEVDFGSSWYDLVTVENNLTKEELGERLSKYLQD